MKSESKIGRYTIKPIRSGSKTVWLVDGRRPSKDQVRRRFDTEQLAKNFIRIELEPEDFQSQNIRPKLTRLTEEELEVAERAFAILPEGTTLLDAVAYFAKNYTPPKTSIRMGEAIPLYRQAKFEAGMVEKSIRQHELFLGRISSFQKIDEISAEQVRMMLDGYGPKSFNTYRTILSSFFRWALQEGFVGANPVKQTTKRKEKIRRPKVYTNDQVKRLLRAARDLHDGALLPYTVLGFFAGIRPEEIQKLKWSDVNLEDAEVIVLEDVAKTDSFRAPALSDNCIEWLRLCWGKDIHPPAYRDKLQEVRLVAGLSVDKYKEERLRKKFNVDPETQLDPWIHDGIRHTAISHHVRRHGNKGMTAEWAGNTVKIIKKHYLSQVTSKEAEAFWNITPENIDGDNMIKFDGKEALA